MSRAYLVPAIKRAFQVIDLLARSGNGLTISDIHRSLKLPLSSAATILYTLQELGYLERDEPTGRYTLGVRMMSFSGRVADQFNLVGRCRPLLEELVRKSGLTGHLAVRRKGESMYVARVPGPGLLQFSSYVGMHWPVHASAAGKALLAFLPGAERARVLREVDLRAVTPLTITSERGIEKQFRNFRRLGYCWESGEGEAGVACVAAPVFGPDREVIAAVSLAGSTQQITKRNLRTLGTLVGEYGRQMSARVGGEPLEGIWKPTSVEVRAT
ncbi:MAG TPA: IclR family transcriptional regulator [Bryobacteraceae bacterium]|nr:IclR family transcriptional regulator [Bryobacteraceae bacterium]